MNVNFISTRILCTTYIKMQYVIFTTEFIKSIFTKGRRDHPKYIIVFLK